MMSPDAGKYSKVLIAKCCRRFCGYSLRTPNGEPAIVEPLRSVARQTRICGVAEEPVRWGASAVVRQRGFGGSPHERLPKGFADSPCDWRRVSRLEAPGVRKQIISRLVAISTVLNYASTAIH
ncbi:hypothetical protein I8748_26020 [Nostoc sp. CENA67]|uniref:Uncharacterized protein n=1 Tax=Amazonocrinis nigriterrae CENA67 TaxID=2794033 RepID=A0A8J7HZW2_9NOST|nr:hypothetical protein [Amazonocrinis nigriterrae]MBH8565589.1 hypothetical protein [Amazonocrinis nigriterrae CENA67]